MRNTAFNPFAGAWPSRKYNSKARANRSCFHSRFSLSAASWSPAASASIMACSRRLNSLYQLFPLGFVGRYFSASPLCHSAHSLTIANSFAEVSSNCAKVSKSSKNTWPISWTNVDALAFSRMDTIRIPSE